MRAGLPGGDPGGLGWIVREIVKSAPAILPGSAAPCGGARCGSGAGCARSACRIPGPAWRDDAKSGAACSPSGTHMWSR